MGFFVVINRNYLLLLVISVFILSACTQGAGQEPGAEAEKVEASSDIETEDNEQESIPLTAEEIQDTVKDSEWYKEAIGDREILFEEFIDFDGDGMKEYIVGTNSVDDGDTRLDIGKFSKQTKGWENLRSELHDTGVYTEPKFYGILDNGNGEEVAVISIMFAGGSGLYEDMRILASQKEDDQLVISSIFEDRNVEGMAPHEYSVDEVSNAFTISTEVDETNYILEENKLIKEDGEVTHLVFDETEMIEEKLVELLDNSFYETEVGIGYNIEAAKSMNADWVEESEVEGGLAVIYEDYALIHGYFDSEISTVALFDFNDLAIQDIEAVLGEEIELSSYYNEMEAREIVSAEFVFERVRYTLELSSVEEGALVEMIYLSLV